MSTPERNARCPCGSGKKYKQCCLHKQARAAQTPLPLRMRQVMAMPKSAPSIVSASDLFGTDKQSVEESAQESAHEEGSPTLKPPTHPSYDSLMERVFGAACTEGKAHLQAKEKDASVTLEQTAETDPRDPTQRK